MAEEAPKKKPRETRRGRKRRKSNVEQRLSAWELAGRGYSLRAIAKELGLSGPQQAKNLVDKGFGEFFSPKVDELRASITEGFDQLRPVFFKRALKGDVEAAREWREQTAALRKLYGVDAPVRTEHTGKDGGPIVIDMSKLSDEQFADLDRQLDALVGGSDGDVEGRADSPPSGSGEGGETPA